MADAIDTIPFCAEWPDFEKRDREEQEAYVASELRRLNDAGEPILRAVFGQLDEWVQFLAMKLLTDGVTSKGAEVIPPRMWYLRLVPADRMRRPDNDDPACVPPSRDPQGRLLPKAEIGKVLVIKTGNVGGNLPTDRDAKQAAGVSGEKRKVADMAGKDLYTTIRVSHEPIKVTLRHASIAIRSWGYGVNPQVFQPGPPDKEGQPTLGRCNWLIEEIDPDSVAHKPRAATPIESRQTGKQSAAK